MLKNNSIEYFLYLILWYIFTLISAICTKLYLNNETKNNEYTFTLVTFIYGFILKLMKKSSKTEIKNLLFNDDKHALLFNYIFLSLLNICGLYLTNVSIKETSVTLVYIAKAFEPILVFLLSYLFLGVDYDIRIKLALIQIIGGVLLSIMGKIQYSFIGLIIIFVANLSTASRSVLYKSFKFDNLNAYNFYLDISFLSFLIMLPRWLYLIIIDKNEMFNFDQTTLIYLIIGTIFNFFYNLLSFTLLKRFSTLTHSIMNIMKRVFVVFGSMIFFHTKLTIIQFVGIFIANIGCLIYSYLKSKIPTKKVEKIISVKMKNIFKNILITSVCLTTILTFFKENNFINKKDPINITLFYWKPDIGTNFGDTLSYELLKRIVGNNISTETKITNSKKRKLLAIGSILHFSKQNDVIWGSGILNLNSKLKNVSKLDVRSVRGPKTREILINSYNISCPPVYGDPALLIPYFFPEFKKSSTPMYPFLVIPHWLSQNSPIFSKNNNYTVVYPTENWHTVISMIVQSELVLASSLHGIIVAESFGIPARLLNINGNIDKEIFKYMDYYYGTGRNEFKPATSIEQGLMMGGEKKFICDLDKLYEAFPREFFGNNLLHSKLPKYLFI
jgi:pyruvyltransferase